MRAKRMRRCQKITTLMHFSEATTYWHSDNQFIESLTYSPALTGDLVNYLQPVSEFRITRATHWQSRVAGLKNPSLFICSLLTTEFLECSWLSKVVRLPSGCFHVTLSAFHRVSNPNVNPELVVSNPKISSRCKHSVHTIYEFTCTHLFSLLFYNFMLTCHWPPSK